MGEVLGVLIGCGQGTRMKRERLTDQKSESEVLEKVGRHGWGQRQRKRDWP